MLNKEQILQDWKYKGYAIIDMLSEQEADDVINELNRLRVARNASDSKWSEYEPYMHPHKESQMIEKIFGHPAAIEAMELTLNTEVQGVQTFKPPGELGRDAHQDGFYSQAGWNKIANISISLDDSDESNGGLWVYEGSHFLPLLDLEIDEDRVKTNPGQWRNERGKASKMPEGHNFPKVYAKMKKGQAMLIHSHVVHGSDTNTGNTFRHSILSGYMQKGGYLRQGEHMKREPVDVYALCNKHWSARISHDLGGSVIHGL
jgi:ectoine hydroxylase-related dioxygenase (phytanoyl-CoA dioxygenase family)